MGHWQAHGPSGLCDCREFYRSREYLEDSGSEDLSIATGGGMSLARLTRGRRPGEGIGLKKAAETQPAAGKLVDAGQENKHTIYAPVHR
jgi:hypothetical protein